MLIDVVLGVVEGEEGSFAVKMGIVNQMYKLYVITKKRLRNIL